MCLSWEITEQGNDPGEKEKERNKKEISKISIFVVIWG